MTDVRIAARGGLGSEPGQTVAEITGKLTELQQELTQTSALLEAAITAICGPAPLKDNVGRAAPERTVSMAFVPQVGEALDDMKVTVARIRDAAEFLRASFHRSPPR